MFCDSPEKHVEELDDCEDTYVDEFEEPGPWSPEAREDWLVKGNYCIIIED